MALRDAYNPRISTQHLEQELEVLKKSLSESDAKIARLTAELSRANDDLAIRDSEIDRLEKELYWRAQTLTRREIVLSHLCRETRQIAMSWSALIEKRVNMNMMLRDLVQGLAELPIRALAFVSSGRQKYLRRQRHDWGLARDRLTVTHSGLFDPTWYINQYPEAGAFGDPLIHYLRHGADQGYDPSAWFDTRGYLNANPDVAAAGANPLVHYIRFGFSEGRQSAPSGAFFRIPDTPEVDPSSLPSSFNFGIEPRSEIAVICHVFYFELWDELASQIGHISQSFDLFVTITEQAGAAELAEAITKRYPLAQVKFVPNHGRDIYPFVALANSGMLERYSLVCKLHTKKSPHLRDGDSWRRDLIRGILGSPENISRILHAFSRNETLGLVVADGHVYNGAQYWIGNNARCNQLALRIGIDINRYSSAFAGGSVFWIRGGVLKRLRNLGLEATSFERESGELDGTTAHAVERLFSIFVAADGYNLTESSAIR